MKIINVNLGERSYKIYIGEKVSNIGRILKKYNLAKNILIITNPFLKKNYGSILQKSLKKAGFEAKFALVPEGEKYKTLKQAEKLYKICVKNRLERNSAIIAFGGGVIGDLAGFVASTFLRGIKLVHVPTTLMAMVDSSIGGKVAVDLKEGKNLIGAFYQPIFVLSDLDVLKSLPEEEIENGLAEIIKYGIISDKKFFEYLEKNISDIKNLKRSEIEYVIYRCCMIKADIVEKDEREELGKRSILNLGHTLGHALEAATNYRMKHGEVIAIGMTTECKIALILGILKEKDFERIINLLKNSGLQTKWPHSITYQKIFPFLERDKKILHEKIRFVLPKRIGNVFVCDNVPKRIIKKAIE